jgi:hypothetical protein
MHLLLAAKALYTSKKLLKLILGGKVQKICLVISCVPCSVWNAFFLESRAYTLLGAPFWIYAKPCDNLVLSNSCKKVLGKHGSSYQSPPTHFHGAKATLRTVNRLIFFMHQSLSLDNNMDMFSRHSASAIPFHATCMCVPGARHHKILTLDRHLYIWLFPTREMDAYTKIRDSYIVYTDIYFVGWFSEEETECVGWCWLLTMTLGFLK